MIALLLAFVGAYGVHLLYTSTAFGWKGAQPGPKVEREKKSPDSIPLMSKWGLGDLNPAALFAAMGVVAALGFAVGLLLFGTLIAAVLLAAFAAVSPVGVARVRHERMVDAAHYAWPGIIEEIRLLTGTLGRSIPQATFEVGLRSHEGLRPAFESAHREWLISTDFARSLEVLKQQLGHNTADIVAETLLTAHELGGGEVGNRLAALATDRMTDQRHRRDAQARQAGVRFARWFTLIVPLGMATTGLSIGDGREAYGTPLGQALVVTALVLVLVFWLWAGRIMALPKEDRVFA